MILSWRHGKRAEPKTPRTGLLLIHQDFCRSARMLQLVAKREVVKSHCLGHEWVGPFSVAETRSRIQKPGRHCLSQAEETSADGTNLGNRIKEKESDAVAERMHLNIQD